MFLKRERPETDDFAIKINRIVKEKYLVEISILQISRNNVNFFASVSAADTLTKNSENASAYFCVSEHSKQL